MIRNNFHLKNVLIISSLFSLLIAQTITGAVPGVSPDLDDEMHASLKDLPFEMPEILLPEFSEQTYLITDFGAVSDGRTLNSTAINQAILKCSQSGGGTVIIPPGLWLTGPIELQSNVNLHLQNGALVVFSPNRADYLIVLPPGKRPTTSPLISGYNLENLAITGEGIFDGNGENWRPVKKFKMTGNQWRELLNSGGVLNQTGDMWWPSMEAMQGESYLRTLATKRPQPELNLSDYLPARDFLRPDLVSLINCKKVLIDGPTFKNSPKYAFHPDHCENMVIRNVKVNNEWWAQNGDGIDLSACKNALINDCTVTAGDDAICLKSSRSRNQTAPAVQNIVIRNCTVYHGHGGFVIGSDTDGGMRNVFVNNCTFIGTDVGLRFKSARDRGGLVENIYIQNIRMKDIANEAVLFNTYYEGLGRENEFTPVSETTPIFTNFKLDSIFCIGASRAVSIIGLPEMPISKIYLNDSYLMANDGFLGEYARDITLQNVYINPKSDPIFNLTHCSGFNLDAIKFSKSSAEFMRLSGKNTQGIHIKNTILSALKSPITFSKEVDKNAVTLE